MLKRLNISNFAIIDNIEIDLPKGLITITGETGAGKSIMLDAMALILGEKIDSKALRGAGNKTVVEATFDVTGYGLDAILDESGVDNFGHECILRREVLESGRSRAFVNDTPVTLPVMRSVAMRLIDIHSQHSNMLLSKRGYQLSVIDSLAGDDGLRARYQAEYKRLRDLSEELERLRQLSERRKDDEDYLRFQVGQIARLNLTEGEDVRLMAQERTLSNINEIKSGLWTAERLLAGEDRSIISDLTAAEQAISRVEPLLDCAQGRSQRLESARIELSDIARTVSLAQSDLADDPAELDRVQSRLNDIYTLERKHKVGSVDELIALRRDMEERLSEIDNSAGAIAAAEAKLAEQKLAAEALAAELTTARKEAAARFSRALVEAAAPLGMENLRFEVKFSPTPLSPAGADAVSFMTSFNRQQELMPVEETASGGEVSRLMLCVKSIIAGSMRLPTIVLDEIDTGVSGEMANRVGEMMRGISRTIQVVAITHLPQVAVKGDCQMKVYKEDRDGATRTSIRRLSAQERVDEIAAMLSGEKIDQAAVNNAKSLLGMG